MHATRPWASRAKQATFEANKIRRLLVLSDGFYRLVDVFGAMSPADLMRRMFTRGAAELCSQLRALEGGDIGCTDHPRVKVHDDASAMLVEINE